MEVTCLLCGTVFVARASANSIVCPGCKNVAEIGPLFTETAITPLRKPTEEVKEVINNA